MTHARLAGVKKTPLHARHVALGAKLVDFAEWDMPLQYAGIQQEHVAVRTDAGLFDVSHMGELSILGAGATDFLRFVTLNDPAKLKPGRGHYSMLPNDQGGLVDDIYLYMHDDEDYLMICNAANRQTVVRHLKRLSLEHDVRVVDTSDDWALLALQGPGSALILGRLIKDDLSGLKKNRKMVARLGELTVDVARTGYTGEDGFEILCRPADAEALWDALIKAGAQPCGLGARDTLRLEAGFPLFGHEFTAQTNPLCSAYAWVVKDKDFYGRSAMWGQACERQLIGFQLTDKGIPRAGHRIVKNNKTIGEVTSGTMSPFTKKSIGMGWVEREYAAPGTTFNVDIRGQERAATVVEPPFFDQQKP